MSLRGPFFLRGADGSGGIRSRRDQIEDQILISLGNRTAVKYSLEGTTVVTHYFVPSYLNLSAPLAWDPTTKQVRTFLYFLAITHHRFAIKVIIELVV